MPAPRAVSDRGPALLGTVAFVQAVKAYDWVYPDGAADADGSSSDE